MHEPDLFFEPWLGAEYVRQPYDVTAVGRSGVYPMHILGESHYSNEERRPSFTIEVVEGLAWSPSRTPYFRNVAKAVSGRDTLSFDEMERIWQNLGFSNYIQEFVSGPRVPPTSDMWARGDRAFAQFLPLYEPDTLLVTGKRLWETMSEKNTFGLRSIERDGVELNDARIHEWTEPSTGKPRWTLAAHIIHPSAPAFHMHKARQRIALLRQWMDNLDLRGELLTFDEQRAKIAA